MNKTLINLLSVIIIIILATYIILPASMMTISFFNTSDTNQMSMKNTPVLFTYSPSKAQLTDISDGTFANDSVGNGMERLVRMENGKKYPVLLESGIIMVPDHINTNSSSTWISFGCISLTFVLFVITVIYLIKFVFTINKGNVFIHKNVKCLNIIGLCQLILAALYIISGISEEYAISAMNLHPMGGGEIGAHWNFPWSNILIGLISLLIAQVWHRGIRLREEQELTI